MTNTQKFLTACVCLLSIGSWVKAQDAGTVLTDEQMSGNHIMRSLNGFNLVMGKANDKGERLYGVVDKNNKVIIPFNCLRDIQFSDGIFVAYQKLGDNDGGFVYIDTLGRHINGEKYFKADPFHEGFAIIEKKEGQLGLLNKQGKETIPCREHYILLNYSEGAVVISPPGGDADMYLADTTGKVLFANSEAIELALGGLHEGLISVIDKKTFKSGYADKQGKIVIPCKYAGVKDFSEGLAAVAVNEKYGYIDKTGKLVIPATFSDAGIFSEGLAGVFIGPEDNSKLGYINKTGKLVIPAIYTGIDSGFKNGVTIVEDDKGNYITIDKTGKKVE